MANKTDPPGQPNHGSVGLMVIAIIGLLVFMFTNTNSSDSDEASQASLNEFIKQLVTEHPDARVSMDLKGAWERGELLVLPEKLPYGHAGSFERISSYNLQRDFGVQVDVDTQSMIVLNWDKLNAARQHELEARSLQKTIRHEYMHYLQWKSGRFFQTEFGDQATKPSCTEMWNREFPIYLEDCFLVEKWWPNQPSIFSPGRCADKDDPSKFAYVVLDLLSGPAPACRSAWLEIVGQMQSHPAN